MKTKYKVVLGVDELRETIKNEFQLREYLNLIFENTDTFIDLGYIQKIDYVRFENYNYICFIHDRDFIVTDLKGNEVYNKLKVPAEDKYKVQNEIDKMFNYKIRFFGFGRDNESAAMPKLPEWCRGIRARDYAQKYFSTAE